MLNKTQDSMSTMPFKMLDPTSIVNTMLYEASVPMSLAVTNNSFFCNWNPLKTLVEGVLVVNLPENDFCVYS